MTHFQVHARELLFDEPIECPLYPPLTFDGVAIDRTDHQYLILRAAATRFYAGPDDQTVRRRAQILAAALLGPALNAELGAVLTTWVEECWTALLDELVDAFAQPLDAL